MTERMLVGSTRTVGRVADEYGVTVRTLHHYDEVGLLVPSERSHAGYRLYTEADVDRLARIVVCRRLGFSLDEVAELLAADADVATHLRRQRATVVQRLDEMKDLVVAIDRALEAEMSGIRLTTEEQRELFGDGYSEEYATEAEGRWGETDAWRQSRKRTSRYSMEDWVAIKAEMDAVGTAFAEAKRAGHGPDSMVAMDAAEQHRRHIHERFYDLSHDAHRGLGDMYVADARFTRTYDDLEPGLAQYVREAIHANTDRHTQ